MTTANNDQIPETPDAVRDTIRAGYAKAATGSGCCGSSGSRAHAERIGYSAEQLADAPDDANLGLGCGNPTALASLKPGETVVDLGAGAGLDAFIAARAVGDKGHVIGIDMTPEMLEKARTNAVKSGFARTVEFRQGLIEALPIVSDSVDVIISNCVINLSTDKSRVFREAFRTLKPGGRLAVSDILLSAPLPPEVAQLASAYVGCIAGAMLADDYLGAIKEAGFVDVRFTRVSGSQIFSGLSDDPVTRAALDGIGPERIDQVAKTIWSYKIEATKP